MPLSSFARSIVVAGAVGLYLAAPAEAGGWGGRAPFVIARGGVFGGGAPMAGGFRRFGGRGLPPVAGVIHEGFGRRAFVTPFGGLRGQLSGYGRHYAYGGYGRRYGPVGGYGYGRALGYGGYRGFGRYGARGAGFAFSYGAFGYGYGAGHTATEAGYLGGGVTYASEPPLAFTAAEPPLAPSPYGTDPLAGPGVAYGGGARVIQVHRRPASVGCDCGGSPMPVVYRYGVGTAY